VAASALVEVELDGKIAVVTGANAGIGKVTALELARAGAKVILACRSEPKGRDAMAEIKAAVPAADLEFLALDLASTDAVRKAAAELHDAVDHVDILVNNAGLAGQRGQTKDGFELTFGTNHIGPYLFTRLVIDLVLAAAPSARIVNVASRAHYRTGPIEWSPVRKPTASKTGFPEYCTSKLANVLFSRELARRLEGRGVDVYALHPGVVASEIWREVPAIARGLMKLFMISSEEGARTSLYCATSPEAAGRTGLYWDRCKPRQPSRHALDDAAASELWRRSAEWLELAVD
jgi:retinol dehydrogenase-12